MSTSSLRWMRRKTSRLSRTRCASSWERRSKTINQDGGPMVDAQYFGDGLTYLNPSDLKGKLIAIEGTGGVARSTHIEMRQLGGEALKDYNPRRGTHGRRTVFKRLSHEL